MDDGRWAWRYDRLDRLRGDVKALTIDLSELTFMDSTGLYIALDAHQRLGGRLRVVLSPPIARLLERAGADWLVPRRIRPDLAITGRSLERHLAEQVTLGLVGILDVDELQVAGDLERPADGLRHFIVDPGARRILDAFCAV